MGTSHWFLDQHFFKYFFYFTRKGTTNNLPFLNTQNRPTLFYNGQWLTVSFELLNKRDPRDSQQQFLLTSVKISRQEKEKLSYQRRHFLSSFFFFFLKFVWFYLLRIWDFQNSCKRSYKTMEKLIINLNWQTTAHVESFKLSSSMVPLTKNV